MSIKYIRNKYRRIWSLIGDNDINDKIGAIFISIALTTYFPLGLDNFWGALAPFS